MVETTTVRCRGVVASTSLSVGDQDRPVMMVPVSLCISSEPSNTSLNAYLTSRGLRQSWWRDLVTEVTDCMAGSFLDATFGRDIGGDRQPRMPGTAIVTDQLLVALLLAYEKSLGAILTRHGPTQ